MHCEEACDLSALPKPGDHLVQVDVGQAIAVIGKKHLFAHYLVADRPQPFADIAPDARVDKRHAPVVLWLAEVFDLCPAARYDAVGECLGFVTKEKVLDHIGFVAHAQHEVPMAVLAVVLHQVPEDRLVADRDHRLWERPPILANACAQTSTEQNDLHGTDPTGGMMLTEGMGTMKRQPQAPTWFI